MTRARTSRPAIMFVVLGAALFAVPGWTPGSGAAAGGTWAVIPSANTGTGANGLAAVSATSSTDAWAVGTYRFTPPGEAPINRTLAERWNGSSWNVVVTP